jgi:acetyltransferase-like isoleucine patch superfamily enzyme
MNQNVNFREFDHRKGLVRGRPKWFEAFWHIIKCLFFLSPLPWPSAFKCCLLRLFGAEVGSGVVIKPRVNIHFPWKLSIGDYSWIGEEVFILNFEQCTIGAHCCISQRAFLCESNFDSLQQELKLVLECSKEELSQRGERGRRLMQESYTWSSVGAQMHEACKEYCF